MNKTKTAALAFLAPVIWGTGFVVTKDSLSMIMADWLLLFRFGIAALFLLPFVWKKRKTINKETVLKGTLIGVLIYGLHILQTVGLQYTTAGKSAFLTTTYIVITPFAAWILARERPTVFHMAGVLISTVGVGMISLRESLSIGPGESLTLLSAVVCAVMYVVTDMISADEDVFVLTWIQLITAALLSLFGGLLLEVPPAAMGQKEWFSVLYLGVVVTGIAFIIQNIGLKYIKSSYASLIFALESVFGCLSGVVFLKERFDKRMLVGCSLMFLAIVISSVKPVKNKKQRR